MKIDWEEYLKHEEEKELERQEMLAYDWWESLWNPNEDAGDRE